MIYLVTHTGLVHRWWAKHVKTHLHTHIHTCHMMISFINLLVPEVQNLKIHQFIISCLIVSIVKSLFCLDIYSECQGLVG